MPQENFDELLLAEILSKSKEHILAFPETAVSKTQARKLQKMQKQLALGMPMAYILGFRWFMGQQFVVNKNTLIPRPETEMLVEMAAEWARTHTPKLAVDIGTGSGAIAVSLSRLLKLKTSIKFVATDVSAQAIKVAKQNAKTLGAANVKFIRGSLIAPVKKDLLALVKAKTDNKSATKSSGGFLITANLPYLSAKELREPSIKHEPKLALYGGKKSFNLIEKLLKELAALQKQSKTKFKNSAVFLEMNYDQALQAKSAIKKYFPGLSQASISIHKDLRGFDRIVKIIFE